MDNPRDGAIAAKKLTDEGNKSVRDQVWNQVLNQVWNQVEAQVLNQVWNQVEAQVWNQVWNQVLSQVWNACYGSQDYSLSYYDTFLSNGLKIEKILGQILLARSTGWWWPFEKVCIITERPSKIIKEGDKVVSIEYPGWKAL